MRLDHRPEEKGCDPEEGQSLCHDVLVQSLTGGFQPAPIANTQLNGIRPNHEISGAADGEGVVGEVVI